MHAAGTFYKSSGLIKPKRLPGYLFGGISLAVLIGWLFFKLCDFLSFVYLNFILLFGVLLLSIIAYTSLRMYSRSRHHVLNIFLSIIFCYVAWSAQWSFFSMQWNYGFSFLEGTFNPGATLQIITRRMVQIDTEHLNRTAGRFPFSGGLAALFYLVEFIGFMLPVAYLWEDRQYYCEGCDKFYERKEAYVTATDNFLTHLGEEGDNRQYRFLPLIQFYGKLAPIYKRKREVIKVTVHYCPKCLDNNIISVSTFEQQPDDDNRNNATLTKEITITEGMYIEKVMAEIIIRKFA